MEWVEIRAVVGESLDSEQVDRAVRQLRRELGEREFETRSVAVDAPDGSKGDASVVGAIAVAVGAGGMVPMMIAVLRDWLGRRSSPSRISVKLGDDTIELDRATFAERERLLEAFLVKYAGE